MNKELFDSMQKQMTPSPSSMFNWMYAAVRPGSPFTTVTGALGA